MNGAQKATKYIGIFIGVLLAIAILNAAIQGGIAVMRIFTDGSSQEEDFAQSYTEDIRSLYIDGGAGEIRLVSAESWRVEASDVTSGFRAQVEGDTLRIRDGRSFFHFMVNRSPVITVYMPAQRLEEISLHLGAGRVSAQSLNADRVRLEGGAGEIEVASVTADDLRADLGVGQTTIRDAQIGKLDISGGVGKCVFFGRLDGDADIDGGVGEILLTLNGREEEYSYRIDNGIGETRLAGRRVGDEKTSHPNAVGTLDVDGGVGSIRIDFAEGKESTKD